jgi:dual specificity MAP kinase phosphatase
MYVPDLCEIAEHLYISGEEAAVHHALHAKLHFTLVVNCTNHSPFLNPRNEFTTYLKLGVEDNLKTKEIRKMTRCLPYVVQLIHDNVSQNGNVLVHCRQGKQRSATIIAAYIMWLQRVSWDTAVKIVQGRRPCAFTPDINFIQSLKFYDTVLPDKSPLTPTAFN